MKYRYKKYHIFRKKINVPKNILLNIYSNKLSFVDYINYNLIDKVPTNCLIEHHRQFVEKIDFIQFKNDKKLITYLNDNILFLNSFDEIKNSLFSYCINENPISIKHLVLLEQLSFENNFVKNANIQLKKLREIRPELDIENPSLNIKLLFDNNIVEKYGSDVLYDILEYDSLASELLLKYTNENDILFERWIKYIKMLPIYDSRMLHHAILCYGKIKKLILDIINNNIDLNDDQIYILHEIILKRNKYNVTNFNELSDYINFKYEKLYKKLQTNDINKLKEYICMILFDDTYYETKSLFNTYGLLSKTFVNDFLFENSIINLNDLKAIEIVHEIINIKEVEELKLWFKNIIKNKKLKISWIKLEQKLKNFFGNEYSKSLFNLSENNKKGIKHYSVCGIDDSNIMDVNGEKLSSRKRINVFQFEGIDFKLLVHKIHGYDSCFKNYADKIINNPSLWNNLEGATTLSTSVISDIYMGVVEGDKCDSVYYGFCNINPKSLMFMGPCDIRADHGGRILELHSQINNFMLPDILQILSKSQYNEVTLNRKGSNNDKYNGRIQPNCIVCFDSINYFSKKAAQYFNIPIYKINKQKYIKRNKNLQQKYINEKITSFSEFDVIHILNNREVSSMTCKVELFLKLLDKAFNDNLIDSKKYKELLILAKNIICGYSAKEPIYGDLSEIKRRIKNI